MLSVSKFNSNLDTLNAITLGTVNLGLGATGLSNGSGAGNLITQFGTSAGGQIKVSYDYSVAAPVPEPETYAMLIGGLGLPGLLRRRSAKKSA